MNLIKLTFFILTGVALSAAYSSIKSYISNIFKIKNIKILKLLSIVLVVLMAGLSFLSSYVGAQFILVIKDVVRSHDVKEALPNIIQDNPVQTQRGSGNNITIQNGDCNISGGNGNSTSC